MADNIDARPIDELKNEVIPQKKFEDYLKDGYNIVDTPGDPEIKIAKKNIGKSIDSGFDAVVLISDARKIHGISISRHSQCIFYTTKQGIFKAKRIADLHMNLQRNLEVVME